MFNDDKSFQHVSSGDAGFYSKPYCKKTRDPKTQGQIRQGLLVSEQNNERLQKGDNRFYLECINSKMGDKKIFTRWYVENIYDFKSFEFQLSENKNFITDIPLKRPDFILKFPDGLSFYMTQLGIAQEFEYRSEWSETWPLE